MALKLPTDPQEQKKLAIAAAPVLLLAAYVYMPFLPGAFNHGKIKAEITALETRYEALETKNKTAKAIADQGAELEKKLAQYEQHMTRLEQLIPRSEEVPELLHAMTLRAQESGVNLALMRPEAETPAAFYIRQSYEMSVIGPYHQVGRFLAAVGSLPRIVTPIDLTLKSNRVVDRAGQELLVAQFRIQTYVLPPAPVAPQQPAQPAGAKPNART